jgi:hypothetical protein
MDELTTVLLPVVEIPTGLEMNMNLFLPKSKYDFQKLGDLPTLKEDASISTLHPKM